MTKETANDGSVTYKVKATNTHDPELITVEGKKIWDDSDDLDGIRPDSITVNLFRDDDKDHQSAEPFKTIEVKADEDGKWTFSFTDLYKYHDGVEYVYRVTEDEVKGYSTSIDGFNITNKHVTEVTPPPYTGDDSQIVLNAVMMGLSMAGLGAIAVKKRKEREAE